MGSVENEPGKHNTNPRCAYHVHPRLSLPGDRRHHTRGIARGTPLGAPYRQDVRQISQLKLTVVLLDDCVALTSELFEFLAVRNLHSATDVFDGLRLLQNTGR